MRDGVPLGPVPRNPDIVDVFGTVYLATFWFPGLCAVLFAVYTVATPGVSSGWAMFFAGVGFMHVAIPLTAVVIDRYMAGGHTNTPGDHDA